MADELPEGVYASVDDLKGLWPDFPTGGDSHATTLLAAASAVMRAECSSAVDADPEILKLVCCEMVKSAMNAPDEASRLSSANLSAGPFSQQLSFKADADDLYLTRKHKRWLGCGRQKAFSVDLIGGGDVS